MQGRHHRNSNDGRGYNSSSNYRSYNRSGSGSFNRKPYLPPPPRCKEEILMEAGRLAAEYLVFKGLLPPNSLPPKWNNSKFQNLRAQDRDSLGPDGRNSALNRLGNSNSDVGHGRRRYGDDYDDRKGPRNQYRGKRRDYGSDWGRENGRWTERSRGYNDMEEEEDDFAPAYRRDRRSGFSHFPLRSEATGESGSENRDFAEDSGSKVSSSSTKKELQSDADGDQNKSIKATNTEAGDEMKSDASADLKKSSLVVEEEEDAHPCEAEGDNKGSDDLVKLCEFARVPTKPRSHRSPRMDEGIPTEGTNTIQEPSAEPKATSGEDIADGSLDDSPAIQTDTKSKSPEEVSLSAVQDVVESVDQQQEACQDPPYFESSKSKPVEAEEMMSKTEGMKRQRDSSSENEDEFPYSRNLRSKQSSPAMESNSAMNLEMVMPATVIDGLAMGEETVAPAEIDQEKPVGDELFPKSEPELHVNLEEEKQLHPTSFKICDLNLMEAPEITEIPDDPDPDTIQPSASNFETEKELSMDFGLSIGNSNDQAEKYNQLSSDDKVVQVIDLDGDSPMHDSSCDASKPRDETMYPSLDSFLNQTEPEDLPEMQDGYSLEISEFLGSDISRCPSVPTDLDNLESGMGLHDTEGVPNDDDSIYVSLGEIPIGFMEVWDHQPPGYGKFF